MKVDTKQERLLRMMDEIDDHAIILLSKQGNIETWNKGAEKIKGYRAEEIIQQNFNIFYSDEDRQLNLPEQLLNKAAREGSAYYEGWRFRKDKSAFWGLITITALHDDQGEVIGFAKITRDLTERVQAETALRLNAQRLENRNKELEQFVYIASHDLQEPLLNVMNFIELLCLEHPEQFDDTARSYLNIISQSADRMKNLIKGLLDYSRLGQERHLSVVDCTQIVDTVKEDLLTRLRMTGATLAYSDLPQLTAYPLELRQLFLNLISNAIKFRKEHVPSFITISAQQSAGCWMFAISDNGIGIDPIHKDKIFLIFQRLHNLDTYEGNGIGLAHCRKIIELHGGDLWVESAPGEGATFFFTIPINY